MGLEDVSTLHADSYARDTSQVSQKNRTFRQPRAAFISH